ncbi:MAG TPA: LpqB family beta-propeller domain-containing protein [Pyrinomonadaceae bacterium]
MSQQNQRLYEFGPFRLDAGRRLLLRDGEPVKVFPKEFDTLLALVERSGEELDKDELMRRVWGDTIVEESNLAKNISALRKVLGESPSQHQYIVTVPGQGYRFVAGVRAAAFDEVQVHEHTRAELTIGEADGEIGGQGEGESGLSNPSASVRHHISPSPLLPVPPSLLVPVTTSVQPNHQRVRVVGAVLLVLAAVATLFSFYRLQRQKIVPPPAFQNTEVKRLTLNGDPRAVALSPDGKFFAYVLNDSEMKRSLWLGHVDGGEPRQLLPPAEVFYPALTFAPDASSLYFTGTDNMSSTNGALYRLPVFGGVSEKVKEKVRNRITFSPDGKQFAFVRGGSDRTSVLVIAETAGTAEREIASRPADSGFSPQSPSWSPDGSLIAVGASNDESGQSAGIFLVSVADGFLKPLTTTGWKEVSMTAWLKDSSGLIAVASDKRFGWDSQLWHVSYPAAEVRRIASDLNTYSYTATISADSKALLAVRGQHQSNIWLAPANNLASAKQITFDMLGRNNGWNGLDWTPDGRVVFTASMDVGQTLWSTAADGSEKKQLLPTGYVNLHPTVTSDGRYVVFESDRSGATEVWRANIDGSDLRQLTGGGKNSQPHVSPDGKWVVYRSRYGDSFALWRVSIDGGEPNRLTDQTASWPRFSPDGKLIACGYGSKLAVLPIEGGQPIKLFDLPRLANFNNGVRWTPDGKSVTYRDWANGIWMQPLNESKPHRIENLPSEKLYSYDWSRDGKFFAFTRGKELRDLVLIRDLR